MTDHRSCVLFWAPRASAVTLLTLPPKYMVCIGTRMRSVGSSEGEAWARAYDMVQDFLTRINRLAVWQGDRYES